MDISRIISTILVCLTFTRIGGSVFVDPGIPYKDGPLLTGELTVTVNEGSPKHAKVYFPLEEGNYSVIYFLGGLSTLVPAEFYSIVLTKLASHGFFVFGVDYRWPLDKTQDPPNRYGQDINTYFQELYYLQKYMINRTLGTPDWGETGLMCHSAGCDIALKMIESKDGYIFKGAAFLEPYSELVKKPVNYTIPALMYGTELAYDFPQCNIHGYGFQQYYKQWKCPRVAVEVAGFGHCDMLDPVGWELCHVSHFCRTTNNTLLGEYRQFVQGVSASFFITMIQGRQDAINYITDPTKLPLKCLVHNSDLNC